MQGKERISSIPLIDLLREAMSLITATGHTTDFGSIFKAGLFSIVESRSSISFDVSNALMPADIGRILARRFLPLVVADEKRRLWYGHTG